MNDPRTQFFDHNFENPFPQNRSRLSQTSNSTNSNNDQELLQFRPDQEPEDSGVCSPPLWKNSPSPRSPSPSPSPSPSRPLLHHRRSLSPNSRILAITRGQKELMEMVKNMPESSYELSLKDLVEKQRIETEPPKLDKRVVVKVKRQESRKNERGLKRIESFEGKSVFLKMGIPFSLKPSKRKKKNFVGNSSGRVSPKPEGGKGGERDWWKKRFSGSSDSNSSGRSNNSGGGGGSGRSDSGRRLNGYFTGCWPFLQSRSSKSVE